MRPVEDGNGVEDGGSGAYSPAPVPQEAVDAGEQIGVVGSPSSTSRLSVDVLGAKAARSLAGALAILRFEQDGRAAYALGQVTEVVLDNPFMRDPTLKGLIRQHGTVDPITGGHDVHAAEMLVSAVFVEDGQGGVRQGSMGTVPPTGTPVRIASDRALAALTAPCAGSTVSIGRVPGAGGAVAMPSWFRHFGPTEEGGTGEASHVGIFGKTGSGKSVLAKMILLSYMRHRGMSFVVLDPQGEFARTVRDPALAPHLRGMGRDVRVHSLHDLLLRPDRDLFMRLLVRSGLLRRIGVQAEENQGYAAEEVWAILSGRYDAGHGRYPDGIALAAAHTREAFSYVINRLGHARRSASGETVHPAATRIYASQQTRERLLLSLEAADSDDNFAAWRGVLLLFGRPEMSGTRLVSEVVGQMGRGDGAAVVLDLDETSAPEALFWSDEVRAIVVNHTLGEIVAAARRRYAERGGGLNTLVVLDEAHRFAPRGPLGRGTAGGGDDGDAELAPLRATLRDAVRTTRKYGLGWMFVSQTLASLDREIVSQLRMYFFGYGLAWGSELDALGDLIGGNPSALRLYQQFRDPESSLGERKYPFMALGPSSPLSFSLIPMFFESLRFPDEFLAAAAGEEGGGDAGAQ